MPGNYEFFCVLFLLLHSEQQDLQNFLEKDSWCKTNYIAPIEQPLNMYLMDLGICSNKIKYLLGIWHMLEDLIFITSIKLGILFAKNLRAKKLSNLWS